MVDLDALRGLTASLDLRPCYLVVAGEQLTGCPTPNSEVLLRGAHLTALEAALGDGSRAPRIDLSVVFAGSAVRVLSEEIEAVAERVRAGDGETIEALHSPLVLVGGEALAELRAISRRCVCRTTGEHYLALAERARRDFEAEGVRTNRPILLLFRHLLAGLHLFETGEVEPDLRRLIEAHDVPFLSALLARSDRAAIGDPGRYGFLLEEAERLGERLERARASSRLPREPSEAPELDELIRRLRSG